MTHNPTLPNPSDGHESARRARLHARIPPYYGPPIPKVLNPLNLRHYGLLLMWIYFQPSRLKRYVWQADPELYFREGWANLRRSVRLPAYRNLLLMVLLLIRNFSC